MCTLFLYFFTDKFQNFENNSQYCLLKPTNEKIIHPCISNKFNIRLRLNNSVRLIWIFPKVVVLCYYIRNRNSNPPSPNYFPKNITNFELASKDQKSSAAELVIEPSMRCITIFDWYQYFYTSSILEKRFFVSEIHNTTQQLMTYINMT